MKAEEIELWELYRNDPVLENEKRLVAYYLPMVKDVATQICPSHHLGADAIYDAGIDALFYHVRNSKNPAQSPRGIIRKRMIGVTMELSYRRKRECAMENRDVCTLAYDARHGTYVMDVECDDEVLKKFTCVSDIVIYYHAYHLGHSPKEISLITGLSDSQIDRVLRSMRILLGEDRNASIREDG